MDNNELTRGWAEVKSSLLEGLSASKRAIVAPLLENQKNHMLNETAAAGATAAGDIANFRKTLLPMIRRIIPGTIATEIVGVQPMSSPVSQVFSLRYKYNEAVTHDPSRSPFGGHDIAPGDESFGNAKPIRAFYSGTVHDHTAGVDGTFGTSDDVNNGPTAQPAGASGINFSSGVPEIDPALAEGAAWEGTFAQKVSDIQFGSFTVPVGGSLLGGGGGTIEGTGGRKMSLEIVSQAIEAGTRKLQAGWTIEAMQDMNSQHGLDLESEITKAVSAEIVQEIDAEIIGDLLALAGTVRTYDHDATGNNAALPGGGNYTPTFVGDRFSHIGVRINEVANEIARKTRRGAGNYIVASPMIVSVLQSAAKSVYAPAVEGSFKGPNNTMLVGTLNGQIKVYSYLWNQAVSKNATGNLVTPGVDQILVGYKGGNGETDAGYFYAPYIPLMSSGVVINPVTFQPVISLMTRYARVAFTNPTSSLGNSGDYYGKINVVNLDFI